LPAWQVKARQIVCCGPRHACAISRNDRAQNRIVAFRFAVDGYDAAMVGGAKDQRSFEIDQFAEAREGRFEGTGIGFPLRWAIGHPARFVKRFISLGDQGLFGDGDTGHAARADDRDRAGDAGNGNQTFAWFL